MRPPSLPVALDAGRHYVAKPSDDASFGVETVIHAAAAGELAVAALRSCTVLTYRNNLNKIFGVPFDPRAEWAVDACLLPVGGGSGGGGCECLFLDVVKLAEQWSGDPADQERFTAWGYQCVMLQIQYCASALTLEDLLRAPRPPPSPDPTRTRTCTRRFEALCTGQEVADSSGEWGAVVRTRIGRHRIVMGAEIDCYDPQLLPPPEQGSRAAPPPPPASWLELKTYRIPQAPQQQRTLHRYKHPKWWLQSFLAGVPRLALGGRDSEVRSAARFAARFGFRWKRCCCCCCCTHSAPRETAPHCTAPSTQGVVHRVDVVATADLARISARGGAPWSADQALQFGDEALAWMRQQAERWPRQHLRFSYRGGGAAGGAITCAAVPLDAGGLLPERVQACLQSCGLTAPLAASPTC